MIVSLRCDFPQLSLLSKSFRRNASMLGLRKIEQCCESIQKQSDFGGEFYSLESSLESFNSLVESNIHGMRDSLCVVQRLVDTLYDVSSKLQ